MKGHTLVRKGVACRRARVVHEYTQAGGREYTHVPCIGKTPRKADHGESSSRPLAYSPIVLCTSSSRGVTSCGWRGVTPRSSDTTRAYMV